MSDTKIPSRKGKVSPTEQKRRARNKAIVPAMKEKKKSLSKIGKKEDTKKLLQRIERGTRKGMPSAQSLTRLQKSSLLPFMKFMSRRGNKKYFIDGKSNFEQKVDPKVKGSIKGNKFLSSFANKLGITTPEFEKEYSKHFKKYEGTEITPKDQESIMKKIKTMSKKMGGGKVYKYKKGTGNKTIKGRMSGNDVVAGCYD